MHAREASGLDLFCGQGTLYIGDDSTGAPVAVTAYRRSRGYADAVNQLRRQLFVLQRIRQENGHHDSDLSLEVPE